MNTDCTVCAPIGSAAPQAKAARLAKAYAPLLRSMDALSDLSDPDAAMGAVLREIGSQLQAKHIVLWLFDGTAGTAVARLAWSGTRPPDDVASLQPDALTEELLASAQRTTPPAPTFGRALASGSSIARTVGDEGAALYPSGRLHLPLAAGGTRFGGVAIQLQRHEQVSGEQVDLVRVLAGQLALMLSLESKSAAREAAAWAQERTRMAREIHDGTAQAFIAINRHLHQALAAADPVAVDAAVAQAVEMAKQGLMEARRSIKALMPGPWNGLSFLDAVRDIARKVVPQGVRFELVSAAAIPALDPDRELHLLKVVQEALSNAVRHASATRVGVEVSAAAEGLTVSIHDNGCGFDPSHASEGLGLVFIRQRADALRGQLLVQSTPGAGTRLVLQLPVA